MSFQIHRPQGYSGKEDLFLPKTIRDLKRILVKAKSSLTDPTLRLPNGKLEELAGILVEFAEDIHNNINIWKSLEQYNIEFFGTPLPLLLRSNQEVEQKAINPYRLLHLLWVLYSELNRELVLSPTHPDLTRLAEQISDFLEDRFTKIPRDPGVKTFLAQPNTFGWDVKKKLTWLGQHSYLFRHNFQNYVKAKGGKPLIPIIDDFVCQETTHWSGLGVIDILAATLNLAEAQRTTLRSWYERHMAYFRVLSVKGPLMEVRNLINDKPYTVRVGEPNSQFKVKQIVFGSLVPWDGEWYWSGEQTLWNDLTEEVIQQLKTSFLQEASKVVYRYNNQLAEKAREHQRVYYREFVEYHGDDLVVYPDGLSMAADLQRQYQWQNESKSRESLPSLSKKDTLPKPRPRTSFPAELLETENGVGVYCNPDDGVEITRGFNDVVNGFKKKGVDLNEDEADGIRGFIYSDAISPRFVRKLVEKYGDESIASVFLIRNSEDKTYLDYLLRRYKGHFYRNRYPGITFV
jgi:hypothetical protein